MRRRPGPCSPPSQLTSRPPASKQLPLVRPLSDRKVVTAPFVYIFRMRLPAMSLKNTVPAASTAGPSRKQTTAAGAAAVSTATSPSGSGVFERSWATHRLHSAAVRATTGTRDWKMRLSFNMAAPRGSAGGHDSSLERLVDELEQRLGRRVVRLAEVRVDLGVGGLLGGEDGCREPRLLEHVEQTLCLCGHIGMSRDMKDQERGNALALGHVRDRGEVAVLLRIVAELLAVA